MGGRLTARDVESHRAAWRQAVSAGMVKERRVSKVAGSVCAIARESPDRQFMLPLAGAGESGYRVLPESLVRVAGGAMLGSVDGVRARTITAERHRRGSALSHVDAVPVVQVWRDGCDARWVDVDARRVAVLEQQDLSRRLYHGLFDSLHRWDVAWLVGHDELRLLSMELWCLIGAGLTVSGAWCRVRGRGRVEGP